mmetsp:Transcript_11840/g.22927  ORF Transcript_11840/g.22927 Transcript_11840/m.22927 type:complete len:509 (-) Transcript_11840:157-1683(-)
MPRSARSQRASEDEIRHCWAMLSVNQRLAATRFEDAVLIGRIRSGVQELFEGQARLRHLGLDPDCRGKSGGSSSFFAPSVLFTDAFDLPWKIAKSKENPDLIIMDPDDQPSLMTLRPQLLESDVEVFERFRRVLPDFLRPSRATRPLLAPVRWKDIFASSCSSVAAMEQRLAQLLEQAFWAMVANPAYAVPETPGAPTCSDTLAADVPFEDWMVDAEQDETRQKKKKKKQKKRVGDVASVATGDDIVQECAAVSKANAESCAKPEEQCVAEEDCTNPADLIQLPLPVSSEDIVNDEEVRSEFGYQNEPCVMEASVEEVGESDEAEVTQDDPLERQIRGEQTRARHYWGTRFRRPSFNRLFTRSRRNDSPSEGNAQEPRCTRAPSTPSTCSMMKPQQLVYYIWNQSSQLESSDDRELRVTPPPTPATTATGTSLASTQLPATPVSRGFWSTVQEDTPYRGVYPTAVVKNTFIDIEATEHTEESRSARSLSPSHWKADTLASFSTSHWHR